MSRQQIALGRVLGIPIGLDYSWFLIFALITWALASSYYPVEFPTWAPAMYWVMGALTAVMLFVSVLLHELGHSAVALRFRIPVRSITLFIFGGVAQIATDPPGALAEFLVAAAGPLVSFTLAALFDGLKGLAPAGGALFGLLEYLAYINAALAIFNLIPGFPLDGGRVFRAIVWAVTRDMRRATWVAAMVGRGFAFLFILYGVWQVFAGRFADGLWIAFIGWFLDNAAAGQIQQQAVQGRLAGHTVAQVMDPHVPAVDGTMTLQEVVDGHVMRTGDRAFLVMEAAGAAGLLTFHRITEVPRDDWPSTAASQVMVPFDRVHSVAPDTPVWQALQQMEQTGASQLPVVTEGRVVGLVSRQDVGAFLRTLGELGT
ncbi:MAG: site-2 protease family protein [Acidobacteriota bacterium]|nr:site-2 protease family protein [Acidobacteriota bacterium]